MLPLLQNVSSVIYAIIVSLLLGYSQDDKYHEQGECGPKEYDFIIVGAGSAGCVVANRLSERENWNVLLIEAGREEPAAAEIPALLFNLEQTDLDWNYKTQPEESACLERKGCPLPRGKVMGGTSSLNAMLYVRGNQEDFDSWARQGNPGWSYKDVLPYFRKSEDNKDQDILTQNPKYHRTGGYQSVSRFPYTDQNTKNILRGLEELGYATTDINGKSQLGSMNLQTTSHEGSRRSTNTAFIRPIRKDRSNLFIRNRAHVTKILINPNTKKAIGVQYTSTVTNKVTTVMAKKEVILSSGSINSPQLLMLSGIGPINELQKHGIRVIQNLSVGHNLQDHVSFLGVTALLSNKTSNNDPKRKLDDLFYYLQTNKGPFSSIGVSTSCAFVRTKYEQSQGAPDIQMIFLGNLENPSYYSNFSILPVLLNPKSKGFVKLNKTDPIWGAPLIYPRFLAKDFDVKRFLEGIRISLKLFNTTAFKKNDFKLSSKPLPLCNEYDFDTDDYWICAMRHYTLGVFHPTGTCKMGPKNDSESVVDSRLRVHGIEGLRVIDASIMPTITRGNTNAPTIMIGEKGSDMIKQDWTEDGCLSD